MKPFRNITIALLLILLNFSKGYPLETDTHELINERIAKGTMGGFSLDMYLKNQLGLTKGKEEVFNKKEIWKWVKEGGRYEDEPAYIRSLNHFHDPLKEPWSSAGFKGTSKSSVIWAQDQELIGSTIGGNWSWKKARDSFYKGLTVVTKTDRENNLADTFRALGQIMHLVQDSSVPAHVRNDTHVYLEMGGLKIGGYHYEIWLKEHHGKLNLTPLGFDKSILNIIPEPSAPVPIANIFDTNKYDIGSDINTAIGFSIGIAEYANANFFSEGTIFKDYPHPTYTDTNFFDAFKYPEKADAEDGKFDNRVYIKKTVGEVDARLAAFSYISYDVIKKGYYQFSPLVLDDRVYNDYAALLTPRAVGYSAGLLNYFFRGEIDMVPDEQAGSGYEIVNETDEDMDGTFELWYDNMNDVRVKTWSASLSIGKKSSGNNKSTNISFDSPTDAKEPDKYMLVFRGKLGNEVDAVAGKQVELKGGEYIFLAFPNYNIAVMKLESLGGRYSLSKTNKNLARAVTIDFPYTVRGAWILGVESDPLSTSHIANLTMLTDYGQENVMGYGKHNTFIPVADGEPAFTRPSDPNKQVEWVSRSIPLGYASFFWSARKWFTLDGDLLEKLYVAGYGQDNDKYQLTYYDSPAGTLKEITDELPTGNKTYSSSQLTFPTEKHYCTVSPPMAFPPEVITTTPTSLNYNFTDTLYPALIQLIDTTPIYTVSNHNETYSERVGMPLTWESEITTFYACSGGAVASETRRGSITRAFMPRNFNATTSQKLMLGEEEIDGFESSLTESSYGWDVQGALFVPAVMLRSEGCSISITPCPNSEPHYWSIGETTTRTSPDGTITLPYRRENKTKMFDRVIDYDYKPSSKIFVMFYEFMESTEISETSVSFEPSWENFVLVKDFWATVGQFSLSENYTSDSRRGYTMAFRISAGIQKVSIPCGKDEAIIDVASHVSDYNIVYTYVVAKLDGKQIKEKTSRVIGIINISDPNLPEGYIQEFEVSDATASQYFSQSSADFKLAGAIGLHKE